MIYTILYVYFQASGGKKDKKKKKGDNFAADQEDPREPEIAVIFNFFLIN